MENVEKELPPNPQVEYGWGRKTGSCPKCGLKDTGHSTMDMHIKRDHPRTPQGTYSCWICPYTFRKHGQFVKHHREGHAGEKMACWVCGEKKWSSTALVYNHIKRDHPGYRKGIAHEYFAALKTGTMVNGKVPLVPSLSSQATSSSYMDSFSDSTSMDSYYSEYSTDWDEDGAPMISSDLVQDEADSLVDEDGAPILESLSSTDAQPPPCSSVDYVDMTEENTSVVTDLHIDLDLPQTQSLIVTKTTFDEGANLPTLPQNTNNDSVNCSSNKEVEIADSILGI